jgi:hypothetical protein
MPYNKDLLAEAIFEIWYTKFWLGISLSALSEVVVGLYFPLGGSGKMCVSCMGCWAERDERCGGVVCK